jgi:hypothetical protein
MKSFIKDLLVGMGSIEIFPSTSVPEIEIDSRSDAKKLASDWERVGGYMYSAMRQVDNEQKTK